MSADHYERHPENTVKSCRYPRLPCDRICLECSGAFDDPSTRTGAVSDDEAMGAMLARFGFQLAESHGE